MLQELRACQCAHCPVLTVTVPKDCKSQHVSPSLPSLILYLYLVEGLKKCVNGFSQTQGTLQTGSIFATFGCLKCGIHAFLGTDSGKIWKLQGCVCVRVCLNLFGFPNFKQLLSHVLPVLQQGTQQKRVSSLSLT